jgi:CRP-like cAMP-binding protein
MNIAAGENSEITCGVLPRGGTLVEADNFRLQIGAYPETIKDTMTSPRGVPDLYLLPDDLFDTSLGVSNSDLEFPVYFNFFIKQKKCRFICKKHQARPMLRVLREAIFGPFKTHTEGEFLQGPETPGYPDLQKEMRYYKLDSTLPGGRLRLKHMVEVYVFDEDGQVEVDGMRITARGRSRYLFENDRQKLECAFAACVEAPSPVLWENSVDAEEGFYTPPVFGVTIIGSGHGFDADSKTAGFIIWIDGKGVLVDPPVNSTLWMKQNRVDARLIEDLVLTHCHADHDSGTLQKILEEGRIRVHTTETVMQSFVAKYSALSGLKPTAFRSLFEFEPLQIGRRTTIAGAHFLFQYNLHPIPTLGFQMEFEGESFYYSCDTLYDPETIQEWHKAGVLSQSRMEQLLNPPWDCTLLLHEAGIPPIHTPISVLASLPEEVKDRMYLVHVSHDAIPEGSGLQMAEPGTANTLEIDVPVPQKSLAYKMLDVVAHIDLFSEMKFNKALECLAITHYLQVEPGEVIIERDTYGDRFFMIMSGEVEVMHHNLPERLFFGRYDYIGETALVLNQPRNADIIARTPTELLYMEKEDFLRFIRDTALLDVLKRLDENRACGARWTFEKHKVLSALSPLQINQLMCSMIHEEIPRDTFLYKIGEPVRWYYLVDKGQVRVTRKEADALLGPGAFIGQFGPSLEITRHTSQAQAHTDLTVYKIGGEEMNAFFRANPGTFVRMDKSLEG